MKALTLHRESKRQTSKNSFLLRYSQIWRKTKLSLDQNVLRCFRKDRSDSPWDCGSILVYTSGKVCRGGRWLETKGNGNASIGGTDVFESSALKSIVKVKLMILIYFERCLGSQFFRHALCFSIIYFCYLDFNFLAFHGFVRLHFIFFVMRIGAQDMGTGNAS